MITVGKYRNLSAVDVDRIRLAGHGVHAIVADEAFATAGYGGLVVDLRLQVQEEDAERAQAILADTSGPSLPDDFDPGPACEDQMDDINDRGEVMKAIARLSRKVENCTLVMLLAVFVGSLYIGFTFRNRDAKREGPSPWDGVVAAVSRLDFETAVQLARPLADLYPHSYRHRDYMAYLYVVIGDLENAEQEAQITYDLAPTEEHEEQLLTIQRLLKKREHHRRRYAAPPSPDRVGR